MAWFYDFCWASGLGIKGNDCEADCHITELEVQLKVLFCRLWTFQEQYKNVCIFHFFQRWILKWTTYMFKCTTTFKIWNALQPNYAFLKLRNSKKATKFEKTSHLFWHLLSSGKTSGRFFSNLCVLFRKPELSANSKQNLF